MLPNNPCRETKGKKSTRAKIKDQGLRTWKLRFETQKG